MREAQPFKLGQLDLTRQQPSRTEPLVVAGDDDAFGTTPYKQSRLREEAGFYSASHQVISMDSDTPNLPPHIEDTVRSISQIRSDHHESGGWSQRLVDTMVATAGRPLFLFLLTLILLCWLGWNSTCVAFGHTPFDPPPFEWLELIASLAALYMTVIILINQQHDDRLGQNREQLILGLSILSEQKVATIISLLEDMRRESPHFTSRTDAGPEDLAQPSDPQSFLKAIKDGAVDREGVS